MTEDAYPYTRRFLQGRSREALSEREKAVLEGLVEDVERFTAPHTILERGTYLERSTILIEGTLARVIREGGKRSGKPGGIHVVEPNMDELKTRIADGFKFLGYGLDVRILDTVCRNDLAEIRKST